MYTCSYMISKSGVKNQLVRLVEIDFTPCTVQFDKPRCLSEEPISCPGFIFLKAMLSSYAMVASHWVTISPMFEPLQVYSQEWIPINQTWSHFFSKCFFLHCFACCRVRVVIVNSPSLQQWNPTLQGRLQDSGSLWFQPFLEVSYPGGLWHTLKVGLVL